MRDELQDLSAQDAAAIAGGDGWLAEWIGYNVGYYSHLVVDAFLTPPPADAFSFARDK